MTTSTDVCNLALDHLAEDPITDIGDNSPIAQRCNRIYNITRQAVLEAHHWSFATVRATITPDPTPPAWSEMNRFLIPSTYLKVRNVYSHGDYRNVLQASRWQVEGEYIVSDIPTVFGVFTEDIVDEDKLSALFIEALAARLAMQMCLPLTENTTLQQTMATIYQNYIDEASVVDASQGRRQTVVATKLTGIRRR
jgi:hypothetical protein